jgi:hypothetical protein
MSNFPYRKIYDLSCIGVISISINLLLKVSDYLLLCNNALGNL